MFFCDACAAERDWPTSAFRSYGRCECCGQSRSCSDIPSRSLPLPLAPTPARTATAALLDSVAEADAAVARLRERPSGEPLTDEEKAALVPVRAAMGTAIDALADYLAAPLTSTETDRVVDGFFGDEQPRRRWWQRSRRR